MEWISVEDRLPEEEGDYLTFIIDSTANRPYEIQYFFKETRGYDSGWTHWSQIDWPGAKVTHWMPIQSPPSN